MPAKERAERLAKDQETMAALEEQSGILKVEPQGGDPPDRYRLILDGQGVARVSALRSDIEWADHHSIEVRMPFMYPEQPPDIRWVTPLFHPNLSYSGFLSLDDVGLPWNPSVGLDVVCERLWDVARLAYINLQNAVNPTAKRWIESAEGIQFPVDPRPLRKIELPGARSNVVRYQRRGDDTVLTDAAPAPVANEVMFIDDDPAASPAPPSSHPSPPPPDDDDGVLYIGE